MTPPQEDGKILTTAWEESSLTEYRVAEGEVPVQRFAYRRGAEATLLAMLTEAPVVLVAGPRQSGKSTLVRHLIADRHPARYLTLDDITLLDSALRDPQGFVDGAGDAPVVIDEIQRAPGLLRAVKRAVDDDRRPGRFLLTGSADPGLLPEVADALTGRMRTLTLWPLSQAEIEGSTANAVDRLFSGVPFVAGSGGASRADVVERIVAGGYPEALAQGAGPAHDRWMSSYLSLMIERDVPRISDIADRTALPRILRTLAARSMQLLNLSEVGRMVEVKRVTLDRYVGLLVAAYLLRMISAWSGDIAREASKRPKPLIIDTGLACHLLGVDEERLQAFPDLLGPLLESFVATELMRQAEYASARMRFAHFRMRNAEVDLVLEDAAGRLVGIEVKATASPTFADGDGLRRFADLVGHRFRQGVLFHTGSVTAPLGEGVWAVPASWLWQSVTRTHDAA